MEDIDKEISEMKITLNARARIVAEEFLKNVSKPSWLVCWIGHSMFIVFVYNIGLLLLLTCFRAQNNYILIWICLPI